MLLAPAARTKGEDGPPPPVRFVAMVLELSETQVAEWMTILVRRDEATQPLMQQLQERQQALAAAMESASPAPQTIGALVIEIRSIERNIMSIRQNGAASFEQLLDAGQLERLQQIRDAAQVCPVVPALEAVGLR
jgi:hypothetical protein